MIMSLMRLLSLGHCVSEVTSGNPYRLAKESYLPSYGVGNVPLTSPAKPQPAAKATTRIESQPVAAARPSWKRRAAAGFSALKMRLPGSRWMKRSNPFATRNEGGKTIAGSPPANPPATPTQAELSLDKVRVMRNDLSDADVEVVLKPVPGRTASGESVSGAPDPLNAKPWNWLATKIFGSS